MHSDNIHTIHAHLKGFMYILASIIAFTKMS